jgi:endonuclease I
LGEHLVKKRLVVSRVAALTALALSADSYAQYEAPLAAYAPPTTYYNAATGTGFALRTNLHNIISPATNGIDDAKFHQRTYGDARYAMGTGDAVNAGIPGGVEFIDPNNAANILLVYNDASITGKWDAGTTWNREHVWPKSLLNLTSSDVSNSYSGVASDAFELMPSNPGINSSRSNNGYGYYINNTTPGPTYGNNTNAGTTYWYPGDLDRGDVARSIFYMATRWLNPANGSRGTDNENLELKNGAPTNYNFGDLNSLLHWNYIDGVNNFERRRNQQIYGSSGDLTNHGLNPSYYQANRNPFIDHPEYVWAIFGVPTQGNNSSKIYLGPTAPGDGVSSTTLSQRVMKNGTFAANSVVLTKSGVTPTTYDITVSGSASTSSAGTGQPFDYNGQTRTLSVALSASTILTGLKTGTVTINNTDLTSLAAGQGSADGNDTITLNGQVVDNRVINATAYSGRVIRNTAIGIPVNLSTTGSDDNNTRPTVKANASGADSNGSFIAAGSDIQFSAPVTLASARSISANFPTVGVKGGTLNFTMQGEGLAGEAVNPVAVTYNVTAVDHSEGSFAAGSNTDAASVDFDYVPQNFARSQAFSVFNKQAVSGQTASLDITSVNVTGDAAKFPTGLAATLTPIAGGGSNNYNIVVNTSAVGTFAATHNVNVADENIPGATSGAPLVLTTSAKVTAGVFPVSGFLNLLPTETWTPASSSIASNVTLTKSGGGTLQLTGAQSHGSNSTLAVSAGTLILGSDAGSAAAAPLALEVGLTGASGVQAVINSTQHLRDLKIIETNRAIVSANGNRTLYTNSLSIDGISTLDLNDNDLVVSGGNFSTLQALVFDGYRGGPDSTATGIISTTGQTAHSGTTILALFDNSLAGFSDYPFGSGNTIAAGAIVGKYTYIGDTNFDGQVSPQDYTATDSNLGTSADPAISWFYGDTNFDGNIDATDYAGIDGALGLGEGNPLAVAGTPAVPEPGTLGLLGAGLLLVRRRRRE